MRPEIKLKLNTSNDITVDLSKQNIEDQDVSEIIREIKRLRPNVQNISFENNKIGDAGAIILGEELEIFSDLSFLNLQFNQIGKKGAIAVFALRTSHTNLNIAFHGNLIIDVNEMEEIVNKSFNEK